MISTSGGLSKGAQVTVRVVQWNISMRSRSELIGDFLRKEIVDDVPTIICLQEVIQNSFDLLVKRLEPDSAAYSLILRPPGEFEGKNRRMGVAILTFNMNILEWGLFDRTVFPERSVWCRCEVNGTTLKVASFHSLTGVAYKNAKVSNFATIADYLHDDHELDFLCFDANEPRVDSIAVSELQFWSGNGDGGRLAGLLMGSNKVHELEDSYRKHLSQVATDKVSELPVTHITRGTGRRYDYIFSAPQWDVQKIGHPLEASLKASSDHSAVIAVFHKTA